MMIAPHQLRRGAVAPSAGACRNRVHTSVNAARMSACATLFLVPGFGLHGWRGAAEIFCAINGSQGTAFAR
jgi:hypothetical protein